MEEKLLCKPCMLGLSEENKKVSLIRSRAEKETCAICGRRRFCNLYSITDKEGGKRQ